MRRIFSFIGNFAKISFYFLIFSILYYLIIELFYFTTGSKPGPEALIWGLIYMFIAPISLVISIILSKKLMFTKSKKACQIIKPVQFLLGLLALPLLFGIIFYTFVIMILPLLDSLVIITAESTYNTKICNLVKNRFSLKNLCIQKIAIKLNDPGVCVKNYQQNEIGYCVASVGLSSTNNLVCDEHKDSLGTQGYEDCINTVAYGSLKFQLCEKIPDSKQAFYCLDKICNQIRFKRMDDRECNEVKSKYYPAL